MATELNDTIINGTLTLHGPLKLSSGCLPISQGGTGSSAILDTNLLLKANYNGTAIEGVSLVNGAYDITVNSALTADTADMAVYLTDSGNSARKIYFSASPQAFDTYLAGFRVDGNDTYTVKDLKASAVTVGNATRFGNNNISVGTFTNTANTICFV